MCNMLKNPQPNVSLPTTRSWRGLIKIIAGIYPWNSTSLLIPSSISWQIPADKYHHFVPISYFFLHKIPITKVIRVVNNTFWNLSLKSIFFSKEVRFCKWCLSDVFTYCSCKISRENFWRNAFVVYHLSIWDVKKKPCFIWELIHSY